MMLRGYTKPTRGNGLLEGFLAKKRAEIVDQLIPLESRNGRLLDVGCGTYPYFLENTHFREKFGVDKGIDAKFARPDSLSLINFNLEHDDRLPFNDGYFEAVTMLAVIEHFKPERAVRIVRECQRVLKDGGQLIITTPALWTEKLLRGMAMLRLVSSEEIAEHKDTYNHSKLAALFCSAGFSGQKMRFGFFEIYMNIWAMVAK